jgi:hypothetical protein
MNPAARVLQSSRREALFTAAVWIAACAWTVGYAALFAYRKEPPPLILGMPGWFVWGVVAPWLACAAVTCWFAFWGIRDEDLDAGAAPDAQEGAR